MITEQGKDPSSNLKYGRKARRFIMGCFCNFFENDTLAWIIIIILLILILNCSCCGGR